MVKSLLFYRMYMSIAIHIHPLSPSICVAWVLRIARDFFLSFDFLIHPTTLTCLFNLMNWERIFSFFYYSLIDFLLNEIWIFFSFLRCFHPLWFKKDWIFFVSVKCLAKSDLHKKIFHFSLSFIRFYFYNMLIKMWKQCWFPRCLEQDGLIG